MGVEWRVVALFPAAVLTVLTLGFPLPAGAERAIPTAVPRAVCGPGSVPEQGMQGRMTAADYGRGVRCNLDVVGHTGPPIGGFRTQRYVDPHGRECAYYDRFPGAASDPTVAFGERSGTYVVDMSDPTRPAIADSLNTPANRSPHESLSVHPGRGLLAAVMGTFTTAPGFVDLYDLTQDCRHPVLLSSLPVGVAGHEGSFSPDGMTYWASAGSGFYTGLRTGTIVAVDVSDPALPAVRLVATGEDAHGLNLSADGNTLYYADAGPTPGLTVLDVSEVQRRVPNPKVRRVSHLTWDAVSIPQTNLPVTIGGRPYLVEVDEFAAGYPIKNPTRNAVWHFFTNRGGSDPSAMVGAARIIDIADPAAPKVVSDLRLEVNSPEARAGVASQDPGAEHLFGYTAHYCAVPKPVDPGIVACSFIASGLRVFDIRDPLHPREVAYFNPPGTPSAPYRALSAPTFAPERNEIWYTDGNYGFFALRLR
jgi:LVIVD repeat-containing protein